MKLPTSEKPFYKSSGISNSWKAPRSTNQSLKSYKPLPAHQDLLWQPPNNSTKTQSVSKRIWLGPKQSCWLVDNLADMHICNDKRLMIDFIQNPTKVRGLTSNSISLGRGKVKIRLVLKDEIERLVLTLTNVFYLPNNLFNFVSLGLLNNGRIYHHNED